MPVEISIVQVMTLGALIACLVFLAVVLIFGWRLANRMIDFAAGFRSAGAERVNGIVQVRGVFDDAASLPPVRTVSRLGATVKEAFNFDAPADADAEPGAGE